MENNHNPSASSNDPELKAPENSGVSHSRVIKSQAGDAPRPSEESPRSALPSNDRIKTSANDRQSSSRSARTLFRVLIPIFAISIFIFGNGDFSGSATDITAAENYIGIVDVNGVITDSADIIKQLSALRDNKNVKGIILRINSPGGTVASSQEIHDMIQDTSKYKTVYASMGDVAASGGLYIAVAADKIFANPGTLTGSIGVIIQSFNLKALMDNFGVQAVVYKSGKNKDILSMYRDPTPEEADILQSVVNDTYLQFVQAVSEGRGMSRAEVEEIADGRIFNGKQAMNNALVDGLKPFNRVFEDMKVELEIPNATLLDSLEPIDKILRYIDAAFNASRTAAPGRFPGVRAGMFYIMPGWGV